MPSANQAFIGYATAAVLPPAKLLSKDFRSVQNWAEGAMRMRHSVLLLRWPQHSIDSGPKQF
jgi:hypothetical protein